MKRTTVLSNEYKSDLGLVCLEILETGINNGIVASYSSRVIEIGT